MVIPGVFWIGAILHFGWDNLVKIPPEPGQGACLPKGIMLGLFTLIITGFLILSLNAGIAPGAVEAEAGTSDKPLFLAFQTIIGEGTGASLLAL